LNVYFRGGDIAALANLIGSLEQTPPSDTLTLTAGSCALDLPTTDAVPDYSSQVAPIILDNCVECHRSGGVGPVRDGQLHHAVGLVAHDQRGRAE
jgi:mono/diheme cytochrome c family protein